MEEPRPYGELLGSEVHGLAGQSLVHTAHLEHHTPRLDDGDVRLRAALAATHPGFGRLLGHGLVGEDVDPDLPSAADLPGHRDTRRLYLAVGDPGRLQGLQPVLAELDVRAALGLATHPAPVRLPVLELLGYKHRLPPDRFWLLVVHAVVDPDLDPDLSHLGLGLPETVIYVRVQGVQGHPIFGDGLGAAHLDAAEPPAALDPGAFGAAADGAGQGPLHGPPERGATDELFGDGLGHEARVELGAGDLAYVDLHFLPSQPLEVAPQGVHLAAALADHDAGAGRVDVHRDLALLGGLPDLDVRYARPVQFLLDVVADLDVLAE